MWRKIAYRGHPAFYLSDLGGFRGARRSHFGERRFEDRVQRAQIDRETLVVIAHEEFFIESQLDAPVLKLLTILQAEHREQQFILELRFQGRPIDIKILCKARRPAISEHVLPPWIMFADAD